MRDFAAGRLRQAFQHCLAAEGTMRIRTGQRAGRLAQNHNQSGLRLRTRVRAGKLASNHNQSGVRVKSRVRAGRKPRW